MNLDFINAEFIRNKEETELNYILLKILGANFKPVKLYFDLQEYEKVMGIKSELTNRGFEVVDDVLISKKASQIYLSIRW